MGSKMKIIVGIALVLGIVSIASLAAPIQAYVNETSNGDLLQTQDRDRLRTNNCDLLQQQDRDRLRTQDRDYTCDPTREQYRERQRANECATNRICNCTRSLEQSRNQNRERTRNLGF